MIWMPTALTASAFDARSFGRHASDSYLRLPRFSVFQYRTPSTTRADGLIEGLKRRENHAHYKGIAE